MSAFIDYDEKRRLTGLAFRSAANSGVPVDEIIKDLDAPLLIAGIPRSRTSMTTMSLVNTGRFWAGDTRKPDERNPIGYFENSVLYNIITRPWLAKRKGLISRAPDEATGPLPPEDQAWCRSAALSAILAQGWLGGKWLLKDPAIAFVASAFKTLFPDAKLLICHRNPMQVFQSMEKFYPYATKDQINQSMNVFSEACDSALREFGQDGLKINTDLLAGMDPGETETLANFVGLERFDVAAAIGQSLAAKKAHDLLNSENRRKRYSTW